MKRATQHLGSLSFGILLLALASGCAKKDMAAAPKTAKGGTTTTAGVVPEGEANADASGGNTATNGEGVTTQSLHLSETIAKACNLPRSDANAHFDFDSTTLPEGDREVLAAFAKCLEGALKGKSVLLIGRADPRGESEYNMGLGGARSDVVRRYLIDLGVADGRMKASSRGEMDAIGTDETSWANDRRVDIDVR